MFSTISFEGRTTKPVEARKVGAQLKVTFDVAVNRTTRDKSGNYVEHPPTFWRCEAWGQIAEALDGAPQGTELVVIGEPITESWTDKDGNEQRITKVKAHAVGRTLRAKKAPSRATAAPAEEQAEAPAAF